MSQRYYWSTMRRDVRKHVQQCLECQRYKCSNLKPAGLLKTPVMAQRFEVLAMDLFGPLPPTDQGERWVFAIEDTATRWIDNGPQFVSDILQKVSYCLGFEQNLTPVYHPSSNPEESRNRDLKTQLAIIVEKEHTKWSTALPAVRFVMDSALHLGVDQSPAYLCFGRELRTPLEVHDDLRAVVESENFVAEITPYLQTISETLKCAGETSERNQDRAKLYADPKRRPGPTYKKGDRVLVDVHALSKADSHYSSKFAPRHRERYPRSPTSWPHPTNWTNPWGSITLQPCAPKKKVPKTWTSKEEPEEVPFPESPQNPIEPTPSQPGTHRRRQGFGFLLGAVSGIQKGSVTRGR
ncbi:uncharacterized protein LOC135125944 [Zophobas morio]|uniref:uncharacterized protein LOC135125944 n=1 Tax=Zophobas morio TaxID=2755281 RepID=UPI00308338FF